jgi:hypothetical protein
VNLGVGVRPLACSAACPGSWLGDRVRGWPLRPSGVLTGAGLVRPRRRAARSHAAVSATGNLTMRWLCRVSGIVWIFSWYTIYLEIFRWHHMTKTLRFNPPPPLPGTDIQPRPGAR